MSTATVPLTLERLQTLTNECVALARTLYPGFTPITLPVVNLKSRRVLGLCSYRAGAITLHYNVAALAVLPACEIPEIVAHEVAHAVESFLYAKSDHALRWQSICSALGGNPSRKYCASAETRAALAAVLPAKRRTRYYEWLRDGEKFWLTRAVYVRVVLIMASQMRGVTCAVKMASVLTHTGTPTGQEVLSATRPAPMWDD